MQNKHVHFTNPNENIKIDFLQMGVHKTPALHKWGPMVRDFFLIHFVISGTGQLNIYGNLYKPRGGDCFMIRPTDLVEYVSDSDDPWEYCWLGFCGQDAAKVAELSGFPEWSPVIRPLYFDEIIEEFKDIDNAILLANDDIGIVMCQSIMWRVLLYLMKGISISEQLKHREMASPLKRDYVWQAIHFIESSYNKPINITHLAEMLSVDRNYLCRIFKKETGTSIKKFLIRYRLGVAATKIRLSKKTFKEIASEIGFEDSLYFSRLFKRQYGVSPSEYRDKP